ncbi:MAG: extracellular solute-binding protein [Leptolyngbyaceae cyanobacterium T60_A2020_046]|nr:extracellular solute-binding protein [Leptolyngbyaceae cyanobacterium T60_A2020_046]
MRRRTLLTGALAVAIAQAACQNQAAALRLTLLKDSLPSRLVQAFRASQGDDLRLRLDTQSRIVDLFQRLQMAQQQGAVGANWSGLGDYWLEAAIVQGLIQPIAAERVPQWAALPEAWSGLLRRDRAGRPTPGGNLWAVPYRWGCLTMVYARAPFRRLGWEPTRWQDLWRSELAGRIALPDHPRVTLGLVLKSLGESANRPDPERAAGLTEALQGLRSQPRLYTDTHYLEALLQGDLWAAVGWSTDIRPVVAQYRQLAAVVPQPGTVLSADVWVRPQGQPTTWDEAEAAWLSYWWQAETLVPMSLFSRGLPPQLLSDRPLPAELKDATLLRPDPAQLAQSEFLTPLPTAAIDRYAALWETLRRNE